VTQSVFRRLLLSSFLVLGSTELALSPLPAVGQGITTGSLTGTVMDGSGAAIQNATVTVTSPSTGVKQTAQTNAQGFFSIRNLQVGAYQVVVEAANFGKKTTGGVTIAAGQATDLGPINLSVGSAATQVEVNATGGAVLQTEDAQVQTTFSSLQTQDLPLNGSLDNIALLTPGVAIGHDASFSNSSGQDLSINGQRSRSNNFEIDGQSNNDNSVAGPQIFFANQDAVQEIQVVTSNFNAQYGRNMGGVVNYITKNGTNAFHGSGYELYTGSFLNSFANGFKNPVFGYCAPGQSASTGCTTPVMPRYVENRWGGTFGGPILKDKLWGFGGTNWDHQRNGFTPSVSPTLTPTPNGIAQLQALYPSDPAVTALAKNGPYGAPGARVASILDPTDPRSTVIGPDGVSHVIEFGQVSRAIAPLFNDQQEIGRLDWQPTANDHAFIRYIYQTDLTAGLGTIYNGNYYNVPATTHSIGVDWSHVFSPHWVNQVRYGFQQSKVFFQGGAQSNCVSTSLADCAASVSIGSGSVGFGYPSNLPQGRTVKVTQAQDNASWQRGNHTVLFGGDYTFQNSPNVFLPDYNGVYSFANFNSFLQGAGTLTLGDGNPVIPFTEPDFSLYIQDNYRIMPSLTLNLGLRYEFFDQAVNKLHSETVARETGPNPFWDPTLPLAERTYPYTNRNWKNFQPRLGFAWNPASLPKLVVRGGYGIQYDPAFYNIFLNSATAAPVINLGAITCDGVTVQCLPASGVIGSAVRAQNLALLPRGVNPNFRSLTNNPPNFLNPRVQTYNLGLQYEVFGAIVGATYIGNHTSQLYQSLNSNPYLLPVANAYPNLVDPASLCSDPGGADNGRLHCGSANVATRANTAFGNYNSLQLQLVTRARHGLTIDANYTYSRAIDNADEIYGATTPNGSTGSLQYAQNPLATDIPERGVANFSYPNLVSIGMNYEVQAFKNRSGLLGKALGGFQISANYLFNNGEPFSIYQFYAANINDATSLATKNSTSYCDPKFNAARIGIDACRPVLANRGAPLGTVGIYVVDPNATFTTQGTGYYNYYSQDANGNLNQPVTQNSVHWLYNNQSYADLVGNPYPGAPRNITRGQSYNNLDAAIIKTTSIREGVSLKLYLNAFNALNRAFLGTPDSNIDDGQGFFGSNQFNSGQYSNGGTTLPAARSIQLGGKITF
jgi:hypothetical protein